MNVRRGLVLDANILMRAVLAAEFVSCWNVTKTRQLSTAPMSALRTLVIICLRFSKSAAST